MSCPEISESPPGNPTETIVKVAVRDLVEFVLQSGDLRSTFMGSGRAMAGTRGHQKIQKSRPDTYKAEVPVSLIYQTPALSLELRGRIDGIWQTKDAVVLEEIKTTTLPLAEITRDNQPLHWAQAKVYAYIYSKRNSLDRIGVQLTYLQLDSLEILEFVSEFTLTELGQFFQALIAQYLEWAAKTSEWQRLRNASIGGLAFPFSRYREGQRQLAVAVYRTIAGGRNLFPQAPTGIGKTVATIFPALKALGEGKIAKIFYLTARTVGRGVAEQTLSGLSQAGLRCKVLTLTAKEKICFLAKPDCRPEVCEFARGHFDRVKPALFGIFERDRFDRETIEGVAESFAVCPFEFSLFLSLWADVIICDYNYAFDPRVYLRRFFAPPTDDFAFLIDEAHNLPDRARDMFSAELRKSEFAALRKQVKTLYPSVARAIGKITPVFRCPPKVIPRGENFSRSAVIGSTDVIRELPKGFVQVLRRFLKLAEEHLIGAEPSPHRDALLEVFFSVTAFIRVSETFDENFVCYFEEITGEMRIGVSSSKTGRVGVPKIRPGRSGHDLKIKLFCLDPSVLLKTAIRRARSAIFFSATLLPMSYFLRILGGTPEDRTVTLVSPFASKQLGLMVIPGVKTEFRVREKSFESIAEIIHTAVSCRRGNYLVYFPSYRYMTSVREVFVSRHSEWKIIEQKTGMSEEERDEFLREFSADNLETLIGFVVMGGIFGEGIDLRGERLIGSIVVGVGLPQICLERDLIRDFFQRKSESGFEVAYRYPGMNRVMQAAGRVIRTEQDRGIVLLIDERFMQAGYRNLFPMEWAHFRIILSTDSNNHGGRSGPAARDRHSSCSAVFPDRGTPCGPDGQGKPAWKSCCQALKRELEVFWKN